MGQFVVCSFPCEHDFCSWTFFFLPVPAVRIFFHVNFSCMDFSFSFIFAPSPQGRLGREG